MPGNLGATKRRDHIMHIEQIRNATIRIQYAGKTFLVDPWLAAKGMTGSFDDLMPGAVADPVKSAAKMPLCDLPKPVSEILDGVDAYIITHIHPDHIDINFATGTVGEGLDKHVLTYAQNEEDAATLKKSGFQQVEILTELGNSLGNVTLTKTPSRHGTKVPCGPACGVLFQGADEKTLYVAGDTIWYDEVGQTLKTYQPDVIVTNNCAAELKDYGRLIMDDEDLVKVCQACPDAVIIASHMEAVSHASLTRDDLRQKLEAKGMAARVLIPADGVMW
jgi:L-ascorbate metabolism protein UlaG (beta-lactamase superfamily)